MVPIHHQHPISGDRSLRYDATPPSCTYRTMPSKLGSLTAELPKTRIVERVVAEHITSLAAKIQRRFRGYLELPKPLVEDAKAFIISEVSASAFSPTSTGTNTQVAATAAAATVEEKKPNPVKAKSKRKASTVPRAKSAAGRKRASLVRRAKSAGGKRARNMAADKGEQTRYMPRVAGENKRAGLADFFEQMFELVLPEPTSISGEEDSTAIYPPEPIPLVRSQSFCPLLHRVPGWQPLELAGTPLWIRFLDV